MSEHLDQAERIKQLEASLASQAQEHERQIAALTDGLRTFGRHRYWCAMVQPRGTARLGGSILDSLPPIDAVCDCGLMAALASSGGRPDATTPPPFDFRAHLQRQREFSERTFGPGARTAGVVDHIRKELREIEADPADIREWIDVVILALDGAWRLGYSPDDIIGWLVAKQAKNEARTWPDWRTAPLDKAIEHNREADATTPPPPVGTTGEDFWMDELEFQLGRPLTPKGRDCLRTWLRAFVGRS